MCGRCNIFSLRSYTVKASRTCQGASVAKLREVNAYNHLHASKGMEPPSGRCADTKGQRMKSTQRAPSAPLCRIFTTVGRQPVCKHPSGTGRRGAEFNPVPC